SIRRSLATIEALSLSMAPTTGWLFFLAAVPNRVRTFDLMSPRFHRQDVLPGRVIGAAALPGVFVPDRDPLALGLRRCPAKIGWSIRQNWVPAPTRASRAAASVIRRKRQPRRRPAEERHGHF